MPCIYQSDAVLTGVVTVNHIAGNRFEFLDRDSYVSCGFSQTAAGFLVDVSLSARLLASQIVPVVKATAPVKPDDFVVAMAPGAAGERLVISSRNTNVGTITLFTGVCIDEVM